MVAFMNSQWGKIPSLGRNKSHSVIRRERCSSVRPQAFFKFGGKKADTGGIIGGMTKDDFTYDEVEQYFNYMGMLAVTGSYEPVEKMMASGLHPCDIILLWAATEGDTPKVEELLQSGADATVKHPEEGKTPLELATKPETIEVLKQHLQS